MTKNQKLIKATDELLGRLNEWRKIRRPGMPIPAELWNRSVELANEQGLSKTARALRLDYTALKKQTDARTQDHPTVPVPQFVELFAPLSGQIIECALEVESTRGARLRIAMKNVAASGLATIIREFAG